MQSSSKLQSLPEKLRPSVLLTTSPQSYIDRAWAASRKCLFSVIFVSLVLSKIFHICAHLRSLTVPSLLAWGPTFFLVDMLLILIARGLTLSFEWRTCRDVAAMVTVLFSVYVSSMLAANISFYVHVGVEIDWRESKTLHRNMPSAKTVLSALGVAVGVDVLILIFAYFATPYLYQATGAFLRIWSSSLSAIFSCCRRKKQVLPDPEMYEQIHVEDQDEEDYSNSESVLLLDAPQSPPQQKGWSLLQRLIVIWCSSSIIFLRCVRPHDGTYCFYSGSLPLAPFYDHLGWLKHHTSLDAIPEFNWLPVGNHALDGFADWYSVGAGKPAPKHYNPLKDPLHIPNLQNDILEPMREVLHNGDVKIKHVLLIKLESTRQDVFPFRADSYIMDRIKTSYEGHIPEEVENRLSKLSRTAEHLTGFKTGFGKDKDHPKPRGGISAKNAYTAGTYTLKSLTGTMCGLNPLAVDSNLEYQHDIYQPCLPHIFNALNENLNTTDKTDDWTSWPWHSIYMQAMFGTYDKQDKLMPALGYQDVMTQESINAAGGKYTPEETPEMKTHGYPDKSMKNYIRDAVRDAEKNNTRLFLTHLTGNTHQPWIKPGEYQEMVGNSPFGMNDQLNRYLNTVAYQDEWLSDILEVLNDTGVANETLLVMAGDHGVSLPNDGGITPYHDSHVGNFHVPLLFSHPKLPQIDVDAAVLSTQILPTILDLLIESSSLNKPSTQITKDLLPLYEGQSMLRPLIPEHNGKQEWQFTVMNPGGTWFAMRSAARPYRLVVPLKPDAQWRFTNVEEDPFELHPVEELDFLSLLVAVQARYGAQVGEWLDEAGHVSQWWISENHRRWKYDADSKKS